MAALRRLLPAGASTPLGLAQRRGVRVLRSEVKDIVFHFAAEECLMAAPEAAQAPLLYLWRPGPVVTIGRHQNPWKECVLKKLEEENVGLVRRKSGGGAVFQDPGCSVFTFVSPRETFSIERNLETVLGALRRLGVNAERSGRNDLVFEGKKISGSAFKHAPERGVSLHHGTVLLDTDMQALGRYLTPNKLKLQAKGIASVGARVMNLKQQFPSLTHDSLCTALADEFRAVHSAPGVQVEPLGEDSPLALSEDFKRHHREMSDSDWTLGRTPDFTHQLETRIEGVALLDLQLTVVAGRVEEAAIYSDALFPEVIDEAMLRLKGADYGRRGLKEALGGLLPLFPEEGPRKLAEALLEWLPANVDD